MEFRRKFMKNAVWKDVLVEFWTWVWMEMWWTDCQIFITSQVCNHVVCLSEIEPCILCKGSQMACFGHIFGCIHNCNGLDMLTLLSNLSDFFQDQNGFLEHRELLKHLYPREYVKSVGRGGSMSTWHPESWESLFFLGVESDWPNWSPHKSFWDPKSKGHVVGIPKFGLGSSTLQKWSSGPKNQKAWALQIEMILGRISYHLKEGI